MKKISPLLFLLFAIACQSRKNESAESATYTMRDYRVVKKMLDTLNASLRAQLDSAGSYTIPYTDLTAGKKRLVFIGTSHVRDTRHPQFALLAKVFEEMQPQIAFNEGGQIPEDRKYSSLDSGIVHDGETGALKYLCDKAGIRMMNGDLNEREEFAALLKTIPKDQVYLYLAVERFLNPYKQGYLSSLTLEEVLSKDFIPYLEKAGFPLSEDEKTMNYLRDRYKHYLHQDLSLDSLVEVQEYYLLDDGIFGDVGRATKVVRDQALLQKIDQALSKYDRVFVVFGGSHRIAVEPALQQIMKRHE